ncbi:MAG: hypothetical protein ACTSQA_03560 [Candidatus Heimdallarchaeaceae archaeon]
MNIVFKAEGRFTVLQCPLCGKVYFHKFFIPKDARDHNIFKCCECGAKMKYLDIKTNKIEIEL